MTAQGSPIPGWEDRLSSLVEKYPALFKSLGNLETRSMLIDDDVDRPIYVCGLARAGTTILLELLATHGDTATHQYRDFPFVFTPFWWNWFRERAEKQPAGSVERFHKDRIMVTPASPEAMEEVVWMAFFPHCHDSKRSNVLDGATSNPEFERFYRRHVAKIIRIRGGSRYLAKGNYNLARLAYLRRMFPDARFVVAVRDPVDHVASLIKQHALFREAEERDGKILNYMRRSGHFEFGLDFRPINLGNTQQVEEILGYFQQGSAVAGWALYWASVYGFLAEQLAGDEQLRSSTIVVDYADLCTEPAAMLQRIYEHCELASDPDTSAQQAGELRAPGYYRRQFTEEDEARIRAATATTYARVRRFCQSPGGCRVVSSS